MAQPRARYAVAVVSVAATVWLLSVARGVLEPLVFAILLWFILNAVAGVYARALRGPDAVPGTPAQLLGALTVIGAVVGLSIMTSNSLADLRENLPTYETNLREMVRKISDMLGMAGPFDLAPLIERIEVTDLALSIAGTAAGFAGELLIVVIYVLFIFAETKLLRPKLAAIAPDPDKLAELTRAAIRIQDEIETYLGVKCVVGFAQAVPTYIVLLVVGIDGAAFWSVVIFLASFVPTIGTLIGIVFPSVLALVQFPTLTPFLIVASVLAAIQILGSNYLEPRMMGSSLNLSPLVILVSIFAGGSIWGITGALVAVPALSVAVIVFSRLPTMRPVAILLSADGRV